MPRDYYMKTVLNMDVLLNIMSIADLDVASRLMRTSRELDLAGPKYLLRDKVKLERASGVNSFVLFMRKDYPHRFPFLQRLEISTGRLPVFAAGALRKLLLDCAHLLEIRQLTIHCAEDFFDSIFDLNEAFALLRHVEILNLFDIGRQANIFLKSFQSRLVAASLGMIPDEDVEDLSSDEEDGDDYDFRNPILQLSNSQDTLGALTVRNCDTYSNPDGLHAPVYPHVEKLTLAANELPDTLHYARAFPNIHTLTLASDPHEYDVLEDGFASFHGYRHGNKLRQLQHGGWRALKAVHGPLVDHFLLGLMCPVERVHLEGSTVETRMFRSVLSTTRPQYVHITGVDADLFLSGEFTGMMRGTRSLAAVRCFEVTLLLAGVIEPDEVNLPKTLDVMVEGIRRIPNLRSFGLSLLAFGLGMPEKESRVPRRGDPAGTLCAAEEYLCDLDLEALAGRILRAVPTMQTVVVSRIGHRAMPNMVVSLGDDAGYEEDAVERIPLKCALGLADFEPA